LGDVAAPSATQASIAISADGERWFIVNASPDLREQIAASPILHPKNGLRSSPIAGVVLTNADVDAIAGLLHLREGTAFAVYAPQNVLAILKENRVFEVVDETLVPRRELRAEAWQSLATAAGEDSGIEVRTFSVPGKVPLYLEDGQNSAALESEEATIALKIRSGESSFVYAANCADITESMAGHFEGAPLVFFDGTLYSDDEMIRQGAGKKTGRRMGHMSLSGEDGSLARLAPLDIGRCIFIHVNNTNPILLRDSPERREVEGAGFEVAYDGMEISL
jgi:pyrroloquinoline quinone biosynthesis protein B